MVKDKLAKPKPRPPHPWGRNLEEARIKLKLSRAEAARRAGVDEGTLANLEKGCGTVAKFEQVCRKLGLDPRVIARRSSR